MTKIWIKVWLDFIVLVFAICCLCLSILIGNPYLFVLFCMASAFLMSELHKDLRNTSRNNRDV